MAQRRSRPPRRKPERRPPNPAAERGAMAMLVRNSMSHGYRIRLEKNDHQTLTGMVASLANDHVSRRPESDPARSNLTVRFEDGRMVALEDVRTVRRAGD